MYSLFPYFFPFMGESPVIPAIYWNVKSPEQRIKEICCRVHYLIEYADKQTDVLNQHSADIEQLKALFKQFQESGFEDYYAQQLEKWIEEHTDYLYSLFAKQVYFGLTDDGYFCAYIPDGWKDISFDTGAIFATPEYGRLILKY